MQSVQKADTLKYMWGGCVLAPVLMEVNVLPRIHGRLLSALYYIISNLCLSLHLVYKSRVSDNFGNKVHVLYVNKCHITICNVLFVLLSMKSQVQTDWQGKSVKVIPMLLWQCVKCLSFLLKYAKKQSCVCLHDISLLMLTDVKRFEHLTLV